MGGGLMQLVAYGAQDIYLTGQPQITFFKAIYRRHTNFAVESIQQTINGNSIPGGRVTVTVSRNGDLLKNLWVEYDPSRILSAGSTGFVAADLGHALFNQLELEIGGQLIDKHYGKWLTIWRELSEVNPVGSKGRLHYGGEEPTYTWGGDDDGVNTGYNPSDFSAPTMYQRMSYTHMGYKVGSTGNNNTLTRAPKRAYVPMAFWFCRNPGLAIPLIALQYHEVKFNINFATLDNLFLPYESTTPTANYSSLQVYADYIYLDTTERRQFAQNAHEYLIDQLQVQSGENSATIRLNFNHPVKELIFTGTPRPVEEPSNNDLVVTGGATPFQIVSDTSTDNLGVVNDLETARADLTMRLVLNGTDRFTDRHITYFTRTQMWDCHTGYGSQSYRDAIGVYSFALRPEEHQPSGTCNFSRIDNAQMKFGGAAASNLNSLDIYAVNYNVLRIMSGMGGLAYSN